MKELLNNAQLGWSHFNYNGKFVVLLFLVLLYFFMRKGGDEKKDDCEGGTGKSGKKSLVAYTVFMVICCAFPVTAVLLMCYQTRFYDYQWIMNYVPMTIVIAMGATVFLEDCRKPLRKKAGVVVLLVLLVVFCGRMGQSVVNPQTEKAVFDAGAEYLQREHAREVLAELVADTGTGGDDAGASALQEELCLWAPREIMASVRSLQPEIYLVYGRNMWDAALGAYTYDTYTEAEIEFYQWMSHAEIHGTLDALTAEGKVIDGVACVQNAVAAGVNRILLPATMQAEALQALEAVLEVEAQKLGEYYLFVL